MKKFPFGDVPEGTFFLTLVSIAGEIILSPVTAMTFVFLRPGTGKMVNNRGFIGETPSFRRGGHFCSFPETLEFRSVPPESCNTVVFLPEKTCAFSKTYVSSST